MRELRTESKAIQYHGPTRLPIAGVIVQLISRGVNNWASTARMESITHTAVDEYNKYGFVPPETGDIGDHRFNSMVFHQDIWHDANPFNNSGDFTNIALRSAQILLMVNLIKGEHNRTRRVGHVTNELILGAEGGASIIAPILMSYLPQIFLYLSHVSNLGEAIIPIAEFMTLGIAAFAQIRAGYENLLVAYEKTDAKRSLARSNKIGERRRKNIASGRLNAKTSNSPKNIWVSMNKPVRYQDSLIKVNDHKTRS